MRQLIDDHNIQRGTQLALWDHDYNAIGLMDPDGFLADRYYDIPDDDTYVVGLHRLWTTANSARDSILANHQVIAFKSCYGASLIETDAMNGRNFARSSEASTSLESLRWTGRSTGRRDRPMIRIFG